MANISEERTPTLKRTLGLSGVVIIGIAWVTPLIVLATIGIIAELSSGAAPTAYLITLVAMLFTAYSYGRMASVHYRTAGSAYTYVGGRWGRGSVSSPGGSSCWTTSLYRWWCG